MTIASVAVQDAFRHDAVDDALRGAQRLRRRFGVARGERLLDVLDRRAHRGAQAHVVVAPLDRLASALARRLDVGHERTMPLKRAGILA